MIRQTEEPTRDQMPEPVLSGYRLEDSPGRREGGSLLFAALAPDGGRVSLQMSSEPAANRRVRARFRRLARIRAELKHPALLGVREVGDEHGRPFIAADRFPLRSLSDVFRNGPVDPATALRLLEPVAEALDAAHAAGLVHRALSGESVLLDGDLPKLDLFGLFAIVGQGTGGEVVRRDPHLHYESPEAARGDEPVPASNVYSLACLLFHALTGRQPFAHHDPVMISYAHVSQPPPKASEHNAELPAVLDGVVERGMAKEPGERPESAGALLASAALLLRTAEATAPQPAPAPAPATSADASQPWLAAAAAPAPPTAVAEPEPEPPARRRPPLKARLAPLWPLLLVALVAAAFGALLGMPGGQSEPTAGAARSSEETAVKRLDAVRYRLRDDLALAATASEQAAVADRLAMAYGRAADALRSPELVSAAQDASAAYARLGDAARENDEDAYETASGDVDAAESEIARR
jgi:serine/threonine-protein kinase